MGLLNNPDYDVGIYFCLTFNIPKTKRRFNAFGSFTSKPKSEKDFCLFFHLKLF